MPTGTLLEGPVPGLGACMRLTILQFVLQYNKLQTALPSIVVYALVPLDRQIKTLCPAGAAVSKAHRH